MEKLRIAEHVVPLIIMCIIGFLTYVFNETKAVERQLMEFKLKVATDYASKEDISEVKAKLDKIFEKLMKD